MNIGDKIPSILGIDQNGKEIKSEDYRGKKIILYSYPKANTSGCTAEACSLQAHKAELQEAGYEIIGVSKKITKTPPQISSPGIAMRSASKHVSKKPV